MPDRDGGSARPGGRGWDCSGQGRHWRWRPRDRATTKGKELTQLEAALRSLEERINVIAETTETTAARISRGDDPLVALEIEQLWALIDTLERDNAILNERLDAITASEGGPAGTPATPSGE